MASDVGSLRFMASDAGTIRFMALDAAVARCAGHTLVSGSGQPQEQAPDVQHKQKSDTERLLFLFMQQYLG